MRHRATSLDDCGEEGPRGYDTVEGLVAMQKEMLAAKELEEPCFHTIKLDSVPSFMAFRHTHPNPRAPVPTAEDCEVEATKMAGFVTRVCRPSPKPRMLEE